ncbi:MAG: hypothetical protein QOG25_3556, partial [Acetobacteraceae bacterium]|nr:hypothetical protein [Acetobacteraceae bacterium]
AKACDEIAALVGNVLNGKDNEAATREKPR